MGINAAPQISTGAGDSKQMRIGVNHIPALDGVRGTAILAVFIYHYGAGGKNNSSPLIRSLAELCGFGWSGVDLFFVLSGFLITGILIDTKRDPGYYAKFYARRALRIFPIYYLFIAIAMLIVPFALFRKEHLFFLVYLGYPAALIWTDLVNLPVGVTHLWSLSLEEQFYGVWPWLVRRLPTPSAFLLFCSCLCGIALATRVLIPPIAYGSLPGRMDALAIGAVIAMLFRGSHWRAVTQLAYPTLLVSLSAIVVMCVLRRSTDRGDPVISTIGFTLVAIFYGALIVLSLGPLSKVFSLRGLRSVGKYSYGLYLYHFPLTAALSSMKGWFSPLPLGWVIYVVVCLIANLVVAVVSFHLLEAPILRLKDRFSYRISSVCDQRMLSGD